MNNYSSYDPPHPSEGEDAQIDYDLGYRLARTRRVTVKMTYKLHHTPW